MNIKYNKIYCKCCSTLTFNNFGRNVHFLIIKKASKSSISPFLFPSLEMIIKTFQDKIITVSRGRFF